MAQGPGAEGEAPARRLGTDSIWPPVYSDLMSLVPGGRICHTRDHHRPATVVPPCVAGHCGRCGSARSRGAARDRATRADRTGGSPAAAATVRQPRRLHPAEARHHPAWGRCGVVHAEPGAHRIRTRFQASSFHKRREATLVYADFRTLRSDSASRISGVPQIPAESIAFRVSNRVSG
jgi:hypothetical protein